MESIGEWFRSNIWAAILAFRFLLGFLNKIFVQERIARPPKMIRRGIRW
ncbi:hypothetical protein [Candidatus Formimonas warabiya]|nr:hypothetical protein [Candidatus Formimonas warabiya]